MRGPKLLQVRDPSVRHFLLCAKILTALPRKTRKDLLEQLGLGVGTRLENGSHVGRHFADVNGLWSSLGKRKRASVDQAGVGRDTRSVRRPGLLDRADFEGHFSRELKKCRRL